MTVPPPIPAPVAKVHRFSVWQLILGISGFLFYLLAIILLLVLMAAFKPGSTAIALNNESIRVNLWVMAFLACLIIPSIIYAIRRLRGNETSPLFIDNRKFLLAVGWMVVWVGVIYLGNHYYSQTQPAFLTAFLNVVTISLPVFFWVALGGFRLKIHSVQRAWGVFSFTQFVSMMATVFIEALFFIGVVIAAGAWLSQQAEFLPYLSILQSQGTLSEQNIQSLVYASLPLIQTPIVYAGIAVGFCLVVPMIEELFKPLAVWFFAGKEISPSEGFFVGMVCGGAFALVESLMMMSMASGDLWITAVFARAGAGLLHVVTAGLSGWALAKSWQDGKYWRVALVYLGVILMHGLWNFFALLMGLNNIVIPVDSALIAVLIPASKWILGGIILAAISLLFFVNSHLQKETLPPVFPVMDDPLQS
jgi:hypothetical protein